MSNIPTPHNSCKDPSKIAKTVLMPGDPLRAKYIAETFLSDVEMFTSVRNIYGYTGNYNGKRISVMASGMGMPSIGIYSYELFKFYGVEEIIRIGSAGSYDKDLHLFDCAIASLAYSDSSFAKVFANVSDNVLYPSKELNDKLKASASLLGVKLYEKNIYSSDVFYNVDNSYEEEVKNHNCALVEMESFALFSVAKALGKKAACLLTVSNSFVYDEDATIEEREKGFIVMMKIALGV